MAERTSASLFSLHLATFDELTVYPFPLQLSSSLPPIPRPSAKSSGGFETSFALSLHREI
jgi:hypothetical protein